MYTTAVGLWWASPPHRPPDHLFTPKRGRLALRGFKSYIIMIRGPVVSRRLWWIFASVTDRDWQPWRKRKNKVGKKKNSATKNMVEFDRWCQTAARLSVSQPARLQGSELQQSPTLWERAKLANLAARRKNKRVKGKNATRAPVSANHTVSLHKLNTQMQV